MCCPLTPSLSASTNGLLHLLDPKLEQSLDLLDHKGEKGGTKGGKEGKERGRGGGGKEKAMRVLAGGTGEM